MTGENRPAIGDFPPGAQIGGYQIQELLGRGGMAVVYRAADLRLDRQVALKVLAPDLTRDSAFRQRFIRESRAGASVDHPNIIPVFEAGEAEGVLFIAMRYVAGRDVRELIERHGPLPPARVVSIVTQIASALDAAHARGLVHRDVKPANMLLGSVGSDTTPDHVYLSDFGLSKVSASAVSLTGTGQFLGTLDYMSPEQVEGRPTDGRTDLYALACAAFEMLTGRPPFQRDQDLAVMWAQVSAPPPSAHELRPELPADVDPVIGRALAKAPESRQHTCMEFAAELRAACALGSGRGRPVPGPVPAPGPGDTTQRGSGVPTGLAAPQPGPQPATELALGAVVGGSGQTPPASGMPPVSGVAPGGEATITEAVRGISGGPLPAGHGYPGGPGGPPPGRAPGVTTRDPDASGYGAPGGYAPGGHGTQGGYGDGGRTGQVWGAGPGYQAPPPRRRGKVLPFLLGLLVIAVLAGAGGLVLYLRATGSPHSGPTTPGTASPHTSAAQGTGSASPSHAASPTSPKAVVKAYYRAINAKDYATAYGLSQLARNSETFAQFEQGYSDTAHDTLTVTGVSGDVVSITLVARHTDGKILQFAGTYTVRGGKIVDSAIARTA